MSEKDSQASQSTGFRALLLNAWDNGSKCGKPRGRAWTVKEFQGALADSGCSASEDAISNWKNGVNLPRRPQLLAILDVFFLDPCAADAEQNLYRQRLYDAWEEETRPGARRERKKSEEPPPALPGDWPRQNPPPSPGPASLELFTPVPDNQGGYRLTGRLDLNAREDESQPGQPIRIGLRQAFVTLKVTENLVTDGSLIGKREAHGNLVPDGGPVKVIGPKAKDGSLQGEVFDGQHIATLAPTDEAGGKVTVKVAAGRRDFIVTALDDSGAPIEGPGKEARDAVLNVLFFEKLQDDEEAGRAVLQKAVLTRPAKGTAKE